MIHTLAIVPAMAIAMVMLERAVANDSRESICVSAASACDDDTDLTGTDVSLLQTVVHVHSKIREKSLSESSDRSASNIADISILSSNISTDSVLARVESRNYSSKRESAAESSNSSSGASLGGQDVHVSMLAHGLGSRTKLAPSSMARTLAWLHHLQFSTIELKDSTLVWLLLVLIIFGGCFVLFMIGASETSRQQKFQDDRPPLLSSMQRSSPYYAPSPTPVTSQPAMYSRTSSNDPRLSPLPVSVPAFQTHQEPVRPPTETSFYVKDVKLPPICPSLILPHTEARFMIEMASLLGGGAGKIHILGTSGRKLLHASIAQMPNGCRSLSICSVGCEEDPRTSVITSASGPSDYLTIYGKAGKKYGEIDCSGGSTARLNFAAGAGAQNRTVLQITMGSKESLAMSACTMDDVLVAKGEKRVLEDGGKKAELGEVWHLNVKPNYDAVLITSCMLALILLRSWPSSGLFSSLSLSPSGTSTSLRPHTSTPWG